MAARETSLNTIKVPGAPDIPGLAFRGFRGTSDYQIMVDLSTQVIHADQLERVPDTPEEVAKEYTSAGEDVRATMIFAEINGKPAGFGHCGSYQEASGAVCVYHFFDLVPEWRRKGIGRAVLHWLEERGRELVCDQEADRKHYKLFMADSEIERIALLESEGYRPCAYHAEMVRPNLEHIPDVPMPDGLELRPTEESHVRDVYEAHREAFRDHIHGVEPSEEDYREWVTWPLLSDRSLWQVAWDTEQNEIAGCILNYVKHRENEVFNRRRGYVEYVSVRRPWRRRGLARAMIAASLRVLKERGMDEAALTSHTENPNKALTLYESMGFRTVRYWIAYQKTL